METATSGVENATLRLKILYKVYRIALCKEVTEPMMTPQELLSRRKALRLSQAKLGKHLGVSWNTIARWERGVAPIGQPAMLDLALRALADELTRGQDGKQ